MAKQTYWKDLVFPTEQPVKFNNVIGLELPRGIVAERPDVVTEGTLRFNTTSGLTELFQGGVWQAIPTSLSIGEINTGINVGAGAGIYKQKSGTDLEFKTLVAGTNITITEASNTVTVSAATIGEVNTASNIGAGTANIYARKIGLDLQFRTIRTASPYLSVGENGDVIEIGTSLTPGEVNTGANVGSGLGVYYGKNTSELQFKSIQAVSPVALIDNTTSISVGLEANPVISGTGSITLPKGSTVQRPGTPVSGMLRYNTTESRFEGYVTNTWIGFLTTATAVNKSGDTMTGSLTMAAGSDITISSGDMNIIDGGLILSSGNLTVTGNVNVDGSINAHNEVLNIGDIVSTGDITVSGTVNGRDLDSDGAIIDQLDILGGGLIAKSGGSFVSRTVSADTANDRLGVSVLNGTGAGNLTIGLDIAGRSAVTELNSSDEFLVHASGVNQKATIGDVADYIDNRMLVVETIEDLRDLNTSTGRYSRFTNVQLLGYYEPGDGGGGTFYKDTDDTTSVDDGGICIVATDSSRWKRVYDRLTVRMFGARGDGITNDYDSFVTAITALPSSGKLIIPSGRYLIGLQLQITKDNIAIEGEQNSVILGRCMLQANNVTIRNIEFDGTNQSNPTSWHLMHIQHGSNHLIENCIFHTLILGRADLNGSDGIYIRAGAGGPSGGGYKIANITLRNIHGYDISRNIISVIQGENILIENVSGNARRCMVDIEPNNTNEWCRNIVVDGVVCDGSKTSTPIWLADTEEYDDRIGIGYQVQLAAGGLDGGERPLAENIVFRNCHLIGNGVDGGLGVQMSRVKNGRIENVYIENMGAPSSGGFFDFRGSGSNENDGVECNNIRIINCNANSRAFSVEATRNFVCKNLVIKNCLGHIYVVGRSYGTDTVPGIWSVIDGFEIEDVGGEDGYTVPRSTHLTAWKNGVFRNNTMDIMGVFLGQGVDSVRRQSFQLENVEFVNIPRPIYTDTRYLQLHMHNVKFSDCGDGTYLIRFTADTSTGNMRNFFIMNNCYAHNCNGRVDVQTCDQAVITGNVWRNSGLIGSGPFNVSFNLQATSTVFTGNNLEDRRGVGNVADYGLTLNDASGTRRATITGNSFFGYNTSGVNIAAASPSHVISDNYNAYPTTTTITSASSITLPAKGDLFPISGTTNITTISATNNVARKVTLLFEDVLTVVSGLNLKLNGDFVSTTNSILELICNGTNWYEVSRTIPTP